MAGKTRVEIRVLPYTPPEFAVKLGGSGRVKFAFAFHEGVRHDVSRCARCNFRRGKLA